MIDIALYGKILLLFAVYYNKEANLPQSKKKKKQNLQIWIFIWFVTFNIH